ncbi:MAG: pyrroline-5-carboxylate reductase [Microthrixaceae bacterium]
MYELELIGGGRMGEALLTGLLADGLLKPAEVAVAEVSEARREELHSVFPGVTVTEDLVSATSVILATKPADAMSALAAASSLGVQRVLSIAAGVEIGSLEAVVGPDVPVIRAMPNTPALVGAGAAAIAGGAYVSEDDMAWAESILGAVGTVSRLPESALDAVTGLSGSGPAYVFLIAEAMIEAGVLEGLPRATADQLVRQTLLGSAKLLADSSDGPEALRAAVTSPAGTTAAGLRVMEQGALRATIIDAISAATERSRELGSH